MQTHDTPIVVRVGVPLTGGALVRAARERGYATLFSANAFAVNYGKGHERAGYFKKFRVPDPEQFGDMDAALDSAGFVAAVKYGDYRWTVEQYMDLAASRDWTFYASRDYCCEAQVAGDRLLRLLRIAATAQMLGRCNRAADARGIKRPMPVLQGWTAAEYALCAQWLPLDQWPDLVGIGSVCRRQLEGDAGIKRILQELDAIVPGHVRWHLFGVKSDALAAVGCGHRVHSMDSMAWDFGARMERRVGRDMGYRISRMEAWATKQHAVAYALQHKRSGHEPIQSALFDREALGVTQSDQEHALEALAMLHVDLLLEDQVDYMDAVYQARQSAYPVLAILHNHGGRLGEAAVQHIDDVVPGFGDALLKVR